jgi:hypothetical protein
MVEWELIETRTPLRLGKPLPLIPFVFHGPRHSLPAVAKVPMAGKRKAGKRKAGRESVKRVGPN